MENKSLNIWSWLIFVVFCIICIYDIVIIDNGHFERMKMMNFRMLEGLLFSASVLFMIRQLNFEKHKEVVIVVVFLCILFILFIGSLVHETQITEELDFQEPDRIMEVTHILSFIILFVLRMYVSLKNTKKIKKN